MLRAILDVNMCSPERSETTQTCGRGNNHQPSPLDYIAVQLVLDVMRNNIALG